MPAVMIYVQHLLGIGHLMRARQIAEAVADLGFDVSLVSGGMPIGGRQPNGVQKIQLPPIRVDDASFTPLRDANGMPIDDAYRENRRELLLAAYESAAPAAVIFETFPFGRRALRFELVPLLERIHETAPRPLVVASVRDILQVQHKVEREREMLEWAKRWFDVILVHGDPRFARFEDTFPLAAELGPPVHYTGFVLAPAAMRPDAGSERREIIVSAGGGGVGIELLAVALAAQPHSRFARNPWRVLAGPNITGAGYERLLREASLGATVERSRVDFGALLRQAFISVSQAGYNTVLDVVASGVRPVVVPFTGNGETEQRARGERLRDFGLAIIVDDTQLTPAILAAAVDEAGSREQWGCWDFDSDGAARSASFIASRIGAGAGQQRLARHEHRRAAPKVLTPPWGKARSAKGAVLWPPGRSQGARSPSGEGAQRRGGRPMTAGSSQGANDSPNGGSAAAELANEAASEVGSTSAWARLDAELDAWHANGRQATLWCRDDDARRDGAALRRLLEIARVADVPVALAAIPAVMEPTFADAVTEFPEATVVQHGYAHRNHAPAGTRSCELGTHRAVAESVAELVTGRIRLARDFDSRFVAVLVPPWNRIDAEVVVRLPGAGFIGLSAFGPRASASPASGIDQVNTHVDLIAWRRGRSFIGVDAAIGRLIGHLQARRAGSADPAEPTGILTHHLDLADASWHFLAELFARTRAHGAATWLDVRTVFGVK